MHSFPSWQGTRVRGQDRGVSAIEVVVNFTVVVAAVLFLVVVTVVFRVAGASVVVVAGFGETATGSGT